MEGAAILTLVLILSGCDGGGGGQKSQQGIAGVSGQVCIDGDTMNIDASYTISLSGAQGTSVQTEPFLLKDAYVASIGGQIRAVERFDISQPEEDLMQLLVWGMGASVLHGTSEETLGTVPLAHRGAVTSLAQLRIGSSPMLVYGSESGLGLIGIDASAKLVDDANSFRPVPARSGPITGVLSVAARADGSLIAFTTADGLLLTTSASALTGNERCADVLSASNVLKVSDADATITYLPVEVKLGKDHAYILAKATGAIPSIAPTYEEAYTPFFQGALIDKSPSIVRAVALSDHQVYEVGFATADESFNPKLYDSFIPTDIDFNGDALFVAGLAYRKTAVQAFLAEKCGSQDQLSCLLASAKDKALATFEQNGVHPFSAGFFTYRDTADFSVASHFESIPVSVFMHIDRAPPYFFRIAVDGGTGYIRGPNFLLPFTRSDTASGKENWVLGQEMDANQGLVPGLPNDLVVFNAGVATTITALREGMTGHSAMMVTNKEGQFLPAMDTGSIYVRVEGGGTAPGGATSVAAIEMINPSGGMLYLENGTARTPITVSGAGGAFISRADYDGKSLAFAWSAPGAEGTEQPWRLAVQRGSDAASRKELVVYHAGANGIFSGFPAVGSGGLLPEEARGVTDLMLLPNKNRMVVLFGGRSGNTRYHQPALFDFTAPASGPYGTPALRGVMTTLSKPGVHEGKILRAATNSDGSVTIYFSAADGIYSWAMTPADGVNDVSGTAVRLFQASGLIDAAVDPSSSSKVAYLSGFNAIVRGLSASSAPVTLPLPKSSTTTKSKAEGARIAIVGNLVFVASPYDVLTAPFLVYDLTKPTQAPATCPACSFVDVNVFEADPRYLLASSISSGIEIYKIGN